jgi:hypothetical protein
MTLQEANAKSNREKQKRDKQISFFVRTMLQEYLRPSRKKRSRKTKANLNKPLVNMTPAEIADAAEAMRVFREEDR